MKGVVLSLVVAVAVVGLSVPVSHGQTYSAIITNVAPTPSGFMVEWIPGSEAVVKWSPDLETPFSELSGTLASGQGSYVDTAHGSDDKSFYRVEIKPQADVVLIPSGEFQMGDTFAEGVANERPLHNVYVSDFYMDKYEVTKALWDEVYNWATNHNYSFERTGSSKASDHPVNGVIWYDVVKWCNARSEMAGLRACYTVGTNVYRAGRSEPDCEWTANGFRLPTEAEWEKAARGGISGNRFDWGNTINHDFANYRANGSEYSYDTSPYTSYTYHPAYNDGTQPYTSPVGSFSPNAFGLYDMTGNVSEWCWDWFGNYYATSPSSNPRGPSSGSQRATRSCNWFNPAYFHRLAFRFGYAPTYTNGGIGFRTVLSAE